MLEMLRSIKQELERVAKLSPDKFNTTLGIMYMYIVYAYTHI